MACAWDYQHLKKLLAGERFPAMVVDLDCLDFNIGNIAGIAGQHNKNIRIATKSIRVPELIRYIHEKGGPAFEGLMCFAVSEAQFLASLGFDDFLIAYPTCDPADIEIFIGLSQSGHKITLMVDSHGHMQLIESAWRKSGAVGKANVCIDVDMSWRSAGMHLGVYRSPVRMLEDFRELFILIQKSEFLQLKGVMGYEAQIAGMGERNPFSPLLNPVKAYIKRKSIKDTMRKRMEIHQFLEKEGFSLEFFNGGGSGSLESTSKEPWITEVTAGSGFLQSHLFDYYSTNHNKPACCFGLPVCRIPQKGTYTCKSGGFVASGETGADKTPLPFLPEGMKMVSNEGFGEVQTPVRYYGTEAIALGDPLFFRPAKAGEIAEHFRDYILVRDGQIVDRVATYRGLGQCFY